jgi:hypothetical protein
MDRDMIEVARAIQRAVPRKYKGWMEGLITNLGFVAPECRASRISEHIFHFIPDKPVEEWHFDALSIWMGKTVDEIKEMAKTIAPGKERDLDFHDPVLHAWEGDEVTCKGYDDITFEDNVPMVRIKGVPVPGKVYTVEKVDVRASSTNVFLKEFPGSPFNSVIFSIA